MPVLISPGVYFREIDLSNFVEIASTTVAGFVITSQTGPLDEKTLVTSVPEAIAMFGLPNLSSKGMYALLQYLRRGNQAWVVRVAGDDKEKPEVDIPGAAYRGSVLSSEVELFTIAASTVASHTGSQSESFSFHAETKASWTGADNADLSGTGLDLGGTPVSDGTLGVTLDGGGNVNVTGIDFTGDVTGADAATTLQTAINANGTFSGLSKTITVTFAASKFTFTSDAYGDAGSVTIAAGTGGTNIFTFIGGAGSGNAVVTGVDANNVVRVIVAGDNSETANGTINVLSTTAAEVASDLNAAFSFIEFSDDDGNLLIEQTVIGTTNTFQIATVNGTAHTTLGLTLGTYAGTNGTDVLNFSLVNTGVTTTPSVTLTAGSRTAAQIVAEVLAEIGPAGSDDGSAEVVNTSSGKKIRFTSKDANATSSVQVLVTSTADTPLGFDNSIHSGNAAASVTLTFAERYYGDTSITVKIANGTDYVVTENEVFKVLVYQNDILVEKYDNVRKVAATPEEEAELFEAMIGTVADPVSKYVTVEDVDGAGSPLVTDTVDGDAYDLDPLGADPSGFVLDPSGAEVIGDIDLAGVASGLQIFSDPEDVNLDILLAPGQSGDEVVTELISIAETRRDCLVLIDPPFGLSVQQVADWHNGVAPYDGHSSLNSSFAMMAYPWVKIYDPTNDEEVWTAPSGHLAAIIAFSDSVSDPWVAPAGLTRGRIPAALDLEISLKKSHRDFLLGNLNRVNTFVDFKPEGPTLFSQVTLHRASSKLAKVNVRRMLLAAQKAIVRACRVLNFEPNDPIMWRSFEALVNPFLSGIANRRGLTEFRVIMNSITNTPDVLDRDEAHAVIFLKPTPTAEKIQIDFVLTSQGANFDTLSSLLF